MSVILTFFLFVSMSRLSLYFPPTLFFSIFSTLTATPQISSSLTAVEIQTFLFFGNLTSKNRISPRAARCSCALKRKFLTVSGLVRKKKNQFFRQQRVSREKKRKKRRKYRVCLRSRFEIGWRRWRRIRRK